MATFRVLKPLARSARWGAIGWGIGLAGVGAVQGALSRSIRDFDTDWLVGTLLYALAGGFGAAVLGRAQRPRGRLFPLVWAGALGLGLGYSVTTWIFYIHVEERLSGYFPLMMAESLRFAAMGALAGAALGAVERNGQSVGRLAFAGALGWALYPWIMEWVWAIPLRTRLILGWVGEIPPDGMQWAIVWAVGNGIGGALAGACLGLAWMTPPPDAAPPAGNAGFTGSARRRLL